jgi:hypothetical protein
MIINAHTSELLGRIITETDTQTRISSFLIGVKQANAAVLSRVELQPLKWEAYSLLHSQLCREIELIGLLQRVTTWSMNPFVYFAAAASNMRLVGELQLVRFMGPPFAMDAVLYQYLALSHALYANVRFIPLLPLEVPATHPYVAFLYRLETVHGQLLQSQIALLRHLPVSLSEGEKERIVSGESRKVKDVLRGFVEEITGQPSAVSEG